jgi:hypothetical protein
MWSRKHDEGLRPPRHPPHVLVVAERVDATAEPLVIEEILHDADFDEVILFPAPHR